MFDERVNKRLALAPARVKVDRRSAGDIILQSPEPLKNYDFNLATMFLSAVKKTPERVLFAQRTVSPDLAQPWRSVTYSQAETKARAIAQFLIDRDYDETTPVMILSGNSIEHGLLTLGAHLAGVPVAPVSPAYSLMSGDCEKVVHAQRLIKPKMVFAQIYEPFSKVLNILDTEGIDVVCCDESSAQIPVTTFKELLETMPGNDIATRLSSITPDSHAKYLLTSGSTGFPKAVINTHRMLSANQQMIKQLWPFLNEEPPILLDWLPWNHTFGGNHNFYLVLNNCGSLYIDDGKPAPALFSKTIDNLNHLSPTIYFNVPAGYGMLISHLEGDEQLCKKFFKNLRVAFYAGAALSGDLWERLKTLAKKHSCEDLFLTTAWGSTETAPLATSAHFRSNRSGLLGLPAPGVKIKMTPANGKYELRVAGPSVTPGYLKMEDVTNAAFDEEGYFKIGDAGKFVDENEHAAGLAFDGRVSEDFKLASGTWVNCSAVRLEVLNALSPFIADAVVAGADRDYLSLFLWLNEAKCTDAFHGDEKSLRDHIRQGLHAYNNSNPGSSTRILRALIAHEAPNMDANEITDKGYINQRAVLDRRQSDIEKLYAELPGAEIICVIE